ncbi:thioredoxin reductase [Halorubrum trapanicum]|uniref:Thioredoxin reductase n=1 Tax=Halorubrum trapanicum TaxID=29284 RepID=A0A8J7RUY5_9EURY|nr:FAD-dependent oxidoreductase [Halorubrum trapanicum]MBP1902092.1 thioredoxin reductase [Halorubrum trapanicum]
MTGSEADVLIVGGGVSGLSAGLFTARHDRETLIVDAGSSILRRNAHLENFPGFPAGVNPRQLLDLLAEQADDAGCSRVSGRVTRVDAVDDGFRVETADGDGYRAEYVVVATKGEVDFLDPLDGVGIVERGKTYVDADERGRTGVDGLYAAGRVAGKPHQAIVCAGHGAEVAVTLLEDDDRPFYHDWTAPEGYFTDRGREVPPGCEEIGPAERRRREDRSLAATRDRFADVHPDDQVTHPSLGED